MVRCGEGQEDGRKDSREQFFIPSEENTAAQAKASSGKGLDKKWETLLFSLNKPCVQLVHQLNLRDSGSTCFCMRTLLLPMQWIPPASLLHAPFLGTAQHSADTALES